MSLRLDKSKLIQLARRVRDKAMPLRDAAEDLRAMIESVGGVDELKPEMVNQLFKELDMAEHAVHESIYDLNHPIRKRWLELKEQERQAEIAPPIELPPPPAPPNRTIHDFNGETKESKQRTAEWRKQMAAYREGSG